MYLHILFSRICNSQLYFLHNTPQPVRQISEKEKEQRNLWFKWSNNILVQVIQLIMTQKHKTQYSNVCFNVNKLFNSRKIISSGWKDIAAWETLKQGFC